MTPPPSAAPRSPPAGADDEHAAPAHAFDAALAAERDTLRALFPLPPVRSAARLRTRRQGTALRNTTAAAFLLATATAALLWADPAWRTERHATAVGERREVHLADGSTLTLDTATLLDVSWHLRTRRVTLRQGRARFAVAPSALRPFDVAAADAHIRVIGTVFDVYRQQALVRVTVLEGQVQVGSSLPGVLASRLLFQGQQWRLDGSGAATATQAADLTQLGAWQQGRLVFDRTPLREALAEVQRYRSAPIRLRDDGRIGGLAVSGAFDTTRIDQMLDLLPRIVPARVQRHPDGSVEIVPTGR